MLGDDELVFNSYDIVNCIYYQINSATTSGWREDEGGGDNKIGEVESE